MVLTDDNYASIVSAVEQGRIIYSNIRKFVYYLVSCNIAEIMDHLSSPSYLAGTHRWLPFSFCGSTWSRTALPLWRSALKPATRTSCSIRPDLLMNQSSTSS